MKKANLIFKDNTPFSLDFDDFYFNSKDGLNESKFVYSEAFEFEENDTFIIAESGFGIGLNFFLTLKRFLQAKKRPKNYFTPALRVFILKKTSLEKFIKSLDFMKNLKKF